MENGLEELELIAVAVADPLPLLELELEPKELKKNPPALPGVGGASVQGNNKNYSCSL